jgi:hypothetical protein
VFFNDPRHLLEYLAMLPHQLRPEAGVVPYGEWLARGLTGPLGTQLVIRALPVQL